jgi:RimJ/RimL family protein N-acetyltransferase
MIETIRLRLVPATLETLRAELDSPSHLSAVARMDVSAEWPPELYDRDPIEYTIHRLEHAPHEADWWLYYFVLKQTDGAGIAIGCGGYKGPPSAEGTVEIGYSVVPEMRRRGFAAEAAAGLIAHAFARSTVRRVIAETLPSITPSIGVLEKCGFHFTGEGSEEGVISYELTREQWQRSAVSA